MELWYDGNGKMDARFLEYFNFQCKILVKIISKAGVNHFIEIAEVLYKWLNFKGSCFLGNQLQLVNNLPLKLWKLCSCGTKFQKFQDFQSCDTHPWQCHSSSRDALRHLMAAHKECLQFWGHKQTCSGSIPDPWVGGFWKCWCDFSWCPPLKQWLRVSCHNCGKNILFLSGLPLFPSSRLEVRLSGKFCQHQDWFWWVSHEGSSHESPECAKQDLQCHGRRPECTHQ